MNAASEFDGLDEFLPSFMRGEQRGALKHDAPPMPQHVHRPERRHPDWRLVNTLCMIRAVKNMSQTELGAKVGVTRRTISNIEQQRHEPALSLALAIAEALDASVHDIFRLRRPQFGPYE